MDTEISNNLLYEGVFSETINIIKPAQKNIIWTRYMALIVADCICRLFMALCLVVTWL